MNTGDSILIEKDGPIRIVTLNRPDALNATTLEMHTRLSEVWQELSSDMEASCVVLTGAGRAFSAGGDFNLMLKLQQDPVACEKIFLETRRVLIDMIRFPLPIIAAVNGPAVGLGCSLAVSSDIVLMSDRSKLADPHINVGLVCGDGGAALWPLHTSMMRAKEYLFTGDPLSPEIAVELGLANRVVAHEQLLDEALKLAHRLAKQPAQALRGTKRALNSHIENAVAGPLEIAIQAEMATITSSDHIEIVKNMLKQSEARRQERGESE